MKLSCEITKKDFYFTLEEQDFINKVAPSFNSKTYKLPYPKTSPLERARLRMIHRNEEHLYRLNSATGETLISIYPENIRSLIVSRADWFSNTWDALDFGFEYDFNQTFFAQYKMLQDRVPRAATVTISNLNSEYTTGTGYCKNCYLINSSEYCEDCYYSKLLQNCKDVVDSSYCYDCELLYQCFNLRKCYSSFWLYNSQQCNDCWFSDSLKGCSNCLFCTNLISKQFFVFNEKVEKSYFFETIKAIFSSEENLRQALEKFLQLKQNRVYKYAEIVNCENCTGDFLRNSKNCLDCYDVVDSEDCINLQVGIKCKDIVDCSNMYLNPVMSYQVLGTIGTNNVHFCLYVFHSSNLYYCEQCFSCHNCFGCVGLRNKSYCIFNKQYNKETYEIESSKIIEQMIKTAQWGQFFPASLSPFAYNKSLAFECYPLIKEQALARGYNWEKDREAFKDEISFIPDFEIEKVPEEICNYVLQCRETGKKYKIQKGELSFYKKNKLPIPRVCPEVRYSNRAKLRNPRQLFERECEVCAQPLSSPFAVNRKERICCEKHFLDSLN